MVHLSSQNTSFVTFDYSTLKKQSHYHTCLHANGLFRLVEFDRIRPPLLSPKRNLRHLCTSSGAIFQLLLIVCTVEQNGPDLVYILLTELVSKYNQSAQVATRLTTGLLSTR